jgi:hypothetical protein
VVTVTAGNGQAERLAELAGEYVKGVLADIDVIVDKAAARAREIPDCPGLAREVAALRVVLGEVLLRVAVLEQDLYERDQAARGKPAVRHDPLREGTFKGHVRELERPKGRVR